MLVSPYLTTNQRWFIRSQITLETMANVQKWLDYLRTNPPKCQGEYSNDKGMCVLGAGRHSVSSGLFPIGLDSLIAYTAMAPETIDTLVSINDGSACTFIEIADMIEYQLMQTLHETQLDDTPYEPITDTLI